MKSLLDNKKNIHFHRICKYCPKDYNNVIDIFEITEKDYNINSSAVIEYRFIHNTSYKSADVALIENNKIKNIFEICYKNKTKEENRPEPWVEINAENLILNINSGEIIDDKGNITIECIRDYKCDECVEYEEDEKQKIKLEWEQYEKDRLEKSIIEKERFEREKIERKKLEDIRIEKEILEREKMKEIEEKYQIEIKRERENMHKILSQDIKCDICKINYCKCDEKNYIKNNYNITICNYCKKQKCKCIRITDYFK
jgi:hypothetical protein